MTIQILIVDDEQPIRESLGGLFEDEGYLVSVAPSGEEAVARFRKHPVDCIFLDIWMPGIDGLETMTRIKQIDPNVPVIMMSGHATIDTAVRATKLGAFDFIEKPFSSDKLLILLRNATEKRRLSIENSDLKYENHRDCPQLIGSSLAIAEVRKSVEKAAVGDAHLLIIGKHGTGKSIAARLLHEKSKRNGSSFITINALVIGKEDMEHELFGYEKGSFPGALHAQRGRLEAGHQGTVFIEEVADIPQEIQQRFIKVIHERRLSRLGNAIPVPCDVRFVICSQYPPNQLLSEGMISKEFYERLRALVIKMPELHERAEDIPDLLLHLVDEQVKHIGGSPVSFSEDAIMRLQAYDWPGNVRELRNYVERCHILYQGESLTAETMLPLDLAAPQKTTVAEESVLSDGFHDARKSFESRYIQHHLEKNDWNVSKTAADIGMERSQLHRKIKSHQLTPPNK